jgi:hypothetical protein
MNKQVSSNYNMSKDKTRQKRLENVECFDYAGQQKKHLAHDCDHLIAVTKKVMMMEFHWQAQLLRSTYRKSLFARW